MSIRTAMILVLASAPLAAQAPPAGATPQPIPRAAFMQKIDSVFVTADANKDGFADRAELEGVQTREFNAQRAFVMKQREALYRRLDKDNNGQLTLAEFNAPVAGAPVKTDSASVLAKFDTNKDGKVSLAENRAPAMSQFDRADTNKDGVLSLAEQKAAGARR
ncbi:MAG: hypothetical protein ABIR87_05930 [Sphingomicrobium sp.]